MWTLCTLNICVGTHTPRGSPISRSTLMETLQPAARDGKSTSEPVRVFHSARGNWKHNSRKPHLRGAPLSLVAGGPERRSYFPPFSSTLARLMWSSQLAVELASELVTRLPCWRYDSNLAAVPTKNLASLVLFHPFARKWEFPARSFENSDLALRGIQQESKARPGISSQPFHFSLCEGSAPGFLHQVLIGLWWWFGLFLVVLWELEAAEHR